jgi:phospholipid/cholesterol/gamma-HCH transport system substrate-binding protein
MRRLVAIAVALTLGVVGVALADDGSADGSYLIRAVFDSADFIVEGEEVRIAGANVGTIEEVDVSRPGEIVSLKDGGEAVPGKAIIVLDIADSGFQDFREDASCIVRPQSLLGEKFVECRPTQPRAAGSEPPPEIEPIPEGERGAGQRLVPLESNGKAVDLDVVNNIMREPEVDRFRIILNELGAGLAARGDDLAEVIRRANPALQQTDRVLATLAAQNKQLAQLASDSDTVLTPLARERRSIRGFIENAGETATASAERRTEIGAGIARLPKFLRELQLTMRDLRGFAEAGTPLARDLREAAAPLDGATRELIRFAPPATRALVTLGDAAEKAGPDIAGSEPVIRQLGDLADSAKPVGNTLTELLRSLRKSGGNDELMTFLYNVGAGFNGFDEYGHFLRASLLVTNCADYVVVPLTGCNANWTGDTSPTSYQEMLKLLREEIARSADGAAGADSGRKRGTPGAEGGAESDPSRDPAPDAPSSEQNDASPAGPDTEPAPGEEGDGSGDGTGSEATASKRSRRGNKGIQTLFEYLIGDGP